MLPVNRQASPMRAPSQSEPLRSSPSAEANKRDRAVTFEPYYEASPEVEAALAAPVAEPLFTAAELSLLPEHLEAWQQAGNRVYDTRVGDVTRFLRGILEFNPPTDGVPVVMFITAGPPPDLPAGLAEKIRFTWPQEPPDIEAPADPVSPIVITAPDGQPVAAASFSFTTSPILASTSPRNSASLASRSSTSSHASPRTSEQFVGWGRNLLGLAQRGDDAHFSGVLDAAPKLSENVATTAQTKQKVAQIEATTQSLAHTKRKLVAEVSIRLLNEIRGIEAPAAFKLDCTKELARQVIAASLKSLTVLPGEAAIFRNMDGLLSSLFVDKRDTAEVKLYEALLHFSVTRGRLAPD